MTSATNPQGVQKLLGHVLTEEKPRRIRLKSIERVESENEKYMGRFSVVSSNASSEVSSLAQPRQDSRISTIGRGRPSSQVSSACLEVPDGPALVHARLQSGCEELKDDSFWQPQPLPGERVRDSRRSRNSVPYPISTEECFSEVSCEVAKPRRCSMLGDSNNDDLAPLSPLHEDHKYADGEDGESAGTEVVAVVEQERRGADQHSEVTAASEMWNTNEVTTEVNLSRRGSSSDWLNGAAAGGSKITREPVHKRSAAHEVVSQPMAPQTRESRRSGSLHEAKGRQQEHLADNQDSEVLPRLLGNQQPGEAVTPSSSRRASEVVEFSTAGKKLSRCSGKMGSSEWEDVAENQLESHTALPMCSKRASVLNPELDKSEVEVGETEEEQLNPAMLQIGKRQSSGVGLMMGAGNPERELRGTINEVRGQAHGCEDANVPNDWTSEDERYNLRDEARSDAHHHSIPLTEAPSRRSSIHGGQEMREGRVEERRTSQRGSVEPRSSLNAGPRKSVPTQPDGTIADEEQCVPDTEEGCEERAEERRATQRGSLKPCATLDRGSRPSVPAQRHSDHSDAESAHSGGDSENEGQLMPNAVELGPHRCTRVSTKPSGRASAQEDAAQLEEVCEERAEERRATQRDSSKPRATLNRGSRPCVPAQQTGVHSDVGSARSGGASENEGQLLPDAEEVGPRRCSRASTKSSRRASAQEEAAHFEEVCEERAEERRATQGGSMKPRATLNRGSRLCVPAQQDVVHSDVGSARSGVASENEGQLVPDAEEVGPRRCTRVSTMSSRRGSAQEEAAQFEEVCEERAEELRATQRGSVKPHTTLGRTSRTSVPPQHHSVHSDVESARSGGASENEGQLVPDAEEPGPRRCTRASTMSSQRASAQEEVAQFEEVIEERAEERRTTQRGSAKPRATVNRGSRLSVPAQQNSVHSDVESAQPGGVSESEGQPVPAVEQCGPQRCTRTSTMSSRRTSALEEGAQFEEVIEERAEERRTTQRGSSKPRATLNRGSRLSAPAQQNGVHSDVGSAQPGGASESEGQPVPDAEECGPQRCTRASTMSYRRTSAHEEGAQFEEVIEERAEERRTTQRGSSKPCATLNRGSRLSVPAQQNSVHSDVESAQPGGASENEGQPMPDAEECGPQRCTRVSTMSSRRTSAHKKGAQFEEVCEERAEERRGTQRGSSKPPATSDRGSRLSLPAQQNSVHSDVGSARSGGASENEGQLVRDVEELGPHRCTRVSTMSFGHASAQEEAAQFEELCEDQTEERRATQRGSVKSRATLDRGSKISVPAQQNGVHSDVESAEFCGASEKEGQPVPDAEELGSRRCTRASTMSSRRASAHEEVAQFEEVCEERVEEMRATQRGSSNRGSRLSVPAQQTSAHDDLDSARSDGASETEGHLVLDAEELGPRRCTRASTMTSRRASAQEEVVQFEDARRSLQSGSRCSSVSSSEQDGVSSVASGSEDGQGGEAATKTLGLKGRAASRKSCHGKAGCKPRQEKEKKLSAIQEAALESAENTRRDDVIGEEQAGERRASLRGSLEPQGTLDMGLRKSVLGQQNDVQNDVDSSQKDWTCQDGEQPGNDAKELLSRRCSNEAHASSRRGSAQKDTAQLEDKLSLSATDHQTSASEIYDTVGHGTGDEQRLSSRVSAYAEDVSQHLNDEPVDRRNSNIGHKIIPMTIEGDFLEEAALTDMPECSDGKEHISVEVSSGLEDAASSQRGKVVRFAEKTRGTNEAEDIGSLSRDVLSRSQSKTEDMGRSDEESSKCQSRASHLQRRPTPHPRGRHGAQPVQSAPEVEAVHHEPQKLNEEDSTQAPANMMGLPAYHRADCRFTLQGCPLFVGITSKPASFVTFDGSATVPIRGAERARVLVLIEHADSAVEAIRSTRCSRADAAALELPGLLRDLSAAFVLHMRGILEPKGLTAIDGVPTALILLVRLVEVLDILVAPEEDPLSNRRGRRSRGGEAADLISGFGERSDNAVAALGGGLGPRGFLPPCLDCLGEGQCLTQLKDAGAHEFATELAIHAALAVRLVLNWTPPLGVPRPCDVLLAIGGHAKLLGATSNTLTELQGCASASARQASPSLDSTKGLGQLALILDSLRLGLRSDTCVDKLLRGGGNSGGGNFNSLARSNRPNGFHGIGRDPVAPLAPLAVQALEHIASCKGPEFTADVDSKFACTALDAAATASVRLLSVLVDLPVVAASAPPNRIACAVKKVFETQPLSMHLTAAVRQLVCCQRRTRGWFGDSGSGFHRSLRNAMAAENVPGECVHAALRALDEGHLEGQSGNDGKPHSVKAEAAACGERYVLFATLYENVEAIACAVHGQGAASEEDLTRLRSRCDEHGERPHGAGSEDDPPPARRSLRSNLGNLRGRIRETCLAPYMK